MHSFLLAGNHVENPRAWLVAAVANASRAYGRRSARLESTTPEALDEMAYADWETDAAELERRLAVWHVLRHVPWRHREMLRMHYLDGHSAVEIASWLGTTRRYVEKRIVLALRFVRQRCGVSRDRTISPPSKRA